jgi:hypothetical protein
VSFKKSLSQGNLGESIFFEVNCTNLEKLDGRNGDFISIHTGEKLELKTDFFSMTKTENFFFERFSNREQQTPGGPWRALEDGSSIFVYFYISDMTYFTFDTQALVSALESILPEFPPTEVQNKGYVTVGYRIPRARLDTLYDVHRIQLTSQKVSSRDGSN